MLVTGGRPGCVIHAVGPCRTGSAIVHPDRLLHRRRQPLRLLGGRRDAMDRLPPVGRCRRDSPPGPNLGSQPHRTGRFGPSDQRLRRLPPLIVEFGQRLSLRADQSALLFCVSSVRWRGGERCRPAGSHSQSLRGRLLAAGHAGCHAQQARHHECGMADEDHPYSWLRSGRLSRPRTLSRTGGRSVRSRFSDRRQRLPQPRAHDPCRSLPTRPTAALRSQRR